MKLQSINNSQNQQSFKARILNKTGLDLASKMQQIIKKAELIGTNEDILVLEINKLVSLKEHPQITIFKQGETNPIDGCLKGFNKNNNWEDFEQAVLKMLDRIKNEGLL